MNLPRSPLFAAILSFAPALASAQDLPEKMPAPPQKPAQEEASPTPATTDKMPTEEVACRERLIALGVKFEEATPIREESGCRADHPITVTEIGSGVAIRPEATLTCAMAEATATYVRDHAKTATKKHLGSELQHIDQVSSYVCRPRNGTSKLSEHAYANALDWGAIELADGTRMEIKPYGRAQQRRARLLAEMRETACGPFKTVLGPGSNADHADHFHFDMAERRNGGSYCK